MTQKLLTLPFRLGFGAARTAFDISAKTLDISATLIEAAIEVVRPSGGQDTEPSPPAAQTRPPREPGVTGQPFNGQPLNGQPAPTQTPPAPFTPPDELPDTPLSPALGAIKTLRDEDEEEIFAELADPGAEEGAGAQLDVDEPWQGYGAMNAATVIDRLQQADRAELALVELYEQTHKKRQTVLNAAAKRLRTLSPPQSE